VEYRPTRAPCEVRYVVIPSSVARLRASAAELPLCHVFMVSTSSHQVYRLGWSSTPAARAAGPKKDTTLFAARSHPYSQEHAAEFDPSQVPYGVPPLVGQVVTWVRNSPGLAVFR
jgi:hypothetical protein